MSQEQGYIVSALKYRPAEWDQVVGQSGITGTLKNALAAEEIAKAYLFCGPRGVGKTTSARIFAKAINAKYIPEGEGDSYNTFELDAASNNSVDDIRQLIDQVRIQPQLGKYKVYIIDEVHMLSTQAFNAFLKTLEEPPPHAIFILATTEKHKVLPTILSRCQIYDFQRITVQDMVAHLSSIAQDQGVTFEEEALHLIATKADGALRDALSLFDQMVSFTSKDLNYASVAANLHVLDHVYFTRIIDAMAQGDVGGALIVYDEILSQGFDSLLFIVGLAEHLRNILVSMDGQTINLLDSPDSVKQEYIRQAQLLDAQRIIDHLAELQKAEVGYRTSKNKRLLTEVALMKLCSYAGMQGPMAEKKKSLAPLERKAKQTVPNPDFVPASAFAAVPSTPAEVSQAAAPVVKAPAPIAPQAITESVATESKSPAAVSPEISQAQVMAEPEPAALVPRATPTEPTPPSESSSPLASSTPTEQAVAKTVAADASQEKSSANPLVEAPAQSDAAPGRPAKSRRKSRSINLGTLDEDDGKIEQQVEDTVERIEGASIDPIALKKAWKTYAEGIHAEGKFSFHSTLVNREPEIIDGNTIKVTLENNVQQDLLEQEKTNLMTFIRTELDHPGIALTAEIDIEDMSNISMRTPKEQLQEMMEKNPTLRTMANEFDLDLDY